MKYFHLLTDRLDVSKALASVLGVPGLWHERTFRQRAQANSETECIFLRYQTATQQELYGYNTSNEWEAIARGLECVDLPEYFMLPAIREIVQQIQWLTCSDRLGRVILVKLPAGKRVYPHSDSGNYANYYQRICIPLLSEPGNVMREGDEVQYMKPGEAWFIDLDVEHEAENLSDQDRITLFVDVKPASASPWMGELE